MKTIGGKRNDIAVRNSIDVTSDLKSALEELKTNYKKGGKLDEPS